MITWKWLKKCSMFLSPSNLLPAQAATPPTFHSTKGKAYNVAFKAGRRENAVVLWCTGQLTFICVGAAMVMVVTGRDRSIEPPHLVRNGNSISGQGRMREISRDEGGENLRENLQG